MEKGTYRKFIPDESSMQMLGGKLAQAAVSHAASDNKVIFLYGQLGAGKTTLTRGFLQGLGYKGRIKSPTYTLVEPYDFSECNVFHFDLYRLQNPYELEAMGIQDYFVPNAICLIEWPEHGKELLPIPDLSCYINMQADSREIKMIAHSVFGETILQRLQHD